MRIVAFILIGIGGAFSLLNWISLIGTIQTKRPTSIGFPAPSLLTALGLSLLAETHHYWWIALFTDYSLFVIPIALPRLIAGAWQTSALTRVKRLQAAGKQRRVELSFHRGGHFTLRITYKPALTCNSYGALVASIGAVGKWQGLPDGTMRLWGYWGERTLILQPADTGCISQEEHFPEGQEHSHHSLGGLEFRPIN